MKFINLTKKSIAIVDDSVHEYLNSFKWQAAIRGKNCYAISTLYGKTKILYAYMHHAVIGRPLSGYVVDHVNGNGLDNRRKNLRIVSHRINLNNTSRHRNGKLVGASFCKKEKRWMSQILVDKKRIFLGHFKSEELAHEKYVEALMDLP